MEPINGIEMINKAVWTEVNNIRSMIVDAIDFVASFEKEYFLIAAIIVLFVVFFYKVGVPKK